MRTLKGCMKEGGCSLGIHERENNSLGMLWKMRKSLPLPEPEFQEMQNLHKEQSLEWEARRTIGRQVQRRLSPWISTCHAKERVSTKCFDTWFWRILYPTKFYQNFWGWGLRHLHFKKASLGDSNIQPGMKITILECGSPWGSLAWESPGWRGTLKHSAAKRRQARNSTAGAYCLHSPRKQKDKVSATVITVKMESKG